MCRGIKFCCLPSFTVLFPAVGFQKLINEQNKTPNWPQRLCFLQEKVLNVVNCCHETIENIHFKRKAHSTPFVAHCIGVHWCPRLLRTQEKIEPNLRQVSFKQSCFHILFVVSTLFFLCYSAGFKSPSKAFNSNDAIMKHFPGMQCSVIG